MHQLRLILTLLFSACIAISFAQTFSKKELNQLSKKTKQYSIIGLGEAEHFYKGYYSSKFEIAKHLVEKESIDVIALEASMNVTSLLNGYINGNISLDLQSTLTSLNEPYSLQKAGLYNCLEIAEMINWLKSYNEDHQKKVELVGIDFQNYSIPLDSLKHYASNNQQHKITNTKHLLDSSMYSILDSNIMVITSSEWIDRFQRAKQNVKSLKAMIGNNENDELFTELEQFTTLWDDPMFPRDSIMYENINRHINEKSRILIWAANFHLENDHQFKGPKKLGVFLKEKYPSEYFIIGVTDQTDENKDKIIYPVKHGGLGKYDMIINVNKGDKCEKLSSVND